MLEDGVVMGWLVRSHWLTKKMLGPKCEVCRREELKKESQEKCDHRCGKHVIISIFTLI